MSKTDIIIFGLNFILSKKIYRREMVGIVGFTEGVKITKEVHLSYEK